MSTNESLYLNQFCKHIFVHRGAPGTEYTKAWRRPTQPHRLIFLAFTCIPARTATRVYGKTFSPREKSPSHPQSNYFQGVHGTFPYLRKYCCINLLSHSLPAHTVCVWALKEQGFSSAKPKKWYMKRRKSCYSLRFDVRQKELSLYHRSENTKSVRNHFDGTRPRRVFWRVGKTGKLWDIKKI